MVVMFSERPEVEIESSSTVSILECVPNFTEGRDFGKIDSIVHAAKRESVAVLHTDIGAAANRTVLTIAGSKAALLDSIFDFTRTATSLIDINKQSGIHPFIGAVDVIPFVPLQGSSIEECNECARTLGERIGSELNIPVFLYGRTATHSKRAHLSFLRQGNHPALKERMLTNPHMKPDYGPLTPHPTAGAVAIGARPILVAFNVSLRTTDVKVAQQIAEAIRTRGPAMQRTPSSLRPRRFPELKAIGWFVAEYNCTQVSMNFTDVTVTPLHTVYETIQELAAQLKTTVLGSELIGLIPKEALLQAGSYFSPQGTHTSDESRTAAAIAGLGLNHHYDFLPSDKIIEERLAQSGMFDTSTNM
jgi:glutamate formiminotransferase/formiminotetrahydrofolate cyclodeaminase